jgi:hypothetical protein
MNFKPTKWKVICSIVIAVAIDIMVSYYELLSSHRWSESVGEPVGTHIGMFLFGPIALTASIASLIIAYIIWSLVQKK